MMMVSLLGDAKATVLIFGPKPSERSAHLGLPMALNIVRWCSRHAIMRSPDASPFLQEGAFAVFACRAGWRCGTASWGKWERAARRGDRGAGHGLELGNHADVTRRHGFTSGCRGRSCACRCRSRSKSARCLCHVSKVISTTTPEPLPRASLLFWNIECDGQIVVGYRWGMFSPLTGMSAAGNLSSKCRGTR